MAFFNNRNQYDILSPQNNGYGTTWDKIKKILFWVLIVLVALTVWGYTLNEREQQQQQQYQQQSQTQQSSNQTHSDDEEDDDDDAGDIIEDFHASWD